MPDPEEHDPQLLLGIVGKTVAVVEPGEVGTDDLIVLRFTDGTGIRLRSWDHEGFASGIRVLPDVAMH